MARRLTKIHGSDGATGNLITAPGQDGPILSQARSRSKGPLSDQVADAPNSSGQCRSRVDLRRLVVVRRKAEIGALQPVADEAMYGRRCPTPDLGATRRVSRRGWRILFPSCLTHAALGFKSGHCVTRPGPPTCAYFQSCRWRVDEPTDILKISEVPFLRSRGSPHGNRGVAASFGP